MYDVGGNRVKKYTRTAGGNWETITYIDGLIEYREDQDGKIQSINHVMDDTKRIATIRDGYDFGDTTPAIKYNLDDHLGSSNVLVDENGTLVNQEEYYPFGETSFGSYAKKRYRFCGKEKDEESGMYYYGARYYSPWLCRFISVDPLAGKYVFQTPYAYADNNPINKMDYNGEGTDGEQPKNDKPKESSTTVVNGVSYETYTIKSGDTLSEIAQNKKVDMGFLAMMNGIKDVNNIKAGDKILIIKAVPGATNKQAEKSAKQTQPQQASAQKMVTASNLPRSQNTNQQSSTISENGYSFFGSHDINLTIGPQIGFKGAIGGLKAEAKLNLMSVTLLGYESKKIGNFDRENKYDWVGKDNRSTIKQSAGLAVLGGASIERKFDGFMYKSENENVEVKTSYGLFEHSVSFDYAKKEVTTSFYLQINVDVALLLGIDTSIKWGIMKKERF